MQRMHTSFPRPPRQPEHLRVLEVVPDVQLERDDERLRGALCLVERAWGRGVGRDGVRVRDGEARGELPDVRGGQVEDERVALDLCAVDGSRSVVREKVAEGRVKTNLAHGTEEGLHSPACKASCGGRLQEDCTERDGRAICDVKRYDGLYSSEEEVEDLVLTSASTTR